MKTLIKTCLWLLAFVPLIVDMKVFFPFTSAKSLFIQTFLILSGILILIHFFLSTTFRQEIVGKVKGYLKQPLFLSVLSFFSVLIISTIFAVDKYLAFWGNLSRAEGLIMILFFFTFFLFTSLVFKKEDWLIFFKISLFTTLILLSKEFVEYFSAGIPRPGSYTGNPTFLAGYLLFSITSALIVFSNKGNSLAWKGVSFITITLSILGILLTQTRGPLLGFVLATIVCFVYTAIKGKYIELGKVNLQKASIFLLILGLLFSFSFILTRENTVWQRVPGLARLAKTNIGNEEDPSTQIRLYVYRSSVEALKPSQNGYTKFFFGWGLENFGLADSKYYFAEQYKYEQRWYDRAHNKFLDILVMNGILGLLTYLAIIFFVFKFLFKKTGRGEAFDLEILAIYFFIISYLTHLMFAFDQISTAIPFYAILAFILLYLQRERVLESEKKPQIAGENTDKREIATSTFLLVLTAFLAFVYVRDTVPGYIQMRKYSALIENAKAVDFEEKIESVFSPNTLAQMNIRRNFLAITNNFYNKNPNEQNKRLLEKAILKGEEYVVLQPLDLVFKATLANMYTRKGNTLKNTEYLKRGEILLGEILALAPNRPDIKYHLALNLSFQNKKVESLELFESVFEKHLFVVEQDRQDFESLYGNLIKYFYEQRDKENLEKVADRLRVNNYHDMSSLDKILEHLNTYNTWPAVKFE